jgi:hypothetical protein
MTTRERKEARAERLREWSDKREAKSDALHAAGDLREERSGIPFGQPILVGHHSERRHRNAIDKAHNATRRAIENDQKAVEMARRADGIEAAAAVAIYSDDVDAKERLTEKIARLEAERDRIKAYNASCRKAAKTGGTGDVSLLDAAQRADIATTARVCAYQLRAGGAFPAYALTNLGGNIARLKQRLATIDRPKPVRTITARYGGTCADCGATLERGELIRYDRDNGARCAPTCEESAPC